MRSFPILPALAVIVVSGCLQSTVGPDVPPPASIQAIQNPIAGQVGAQVEPEVRVRDAVGADMAGIAVLWTGAEGLTLNPSSSSTDASGTATTIATLGTIAGEFEVRATVTGLAPLAITVNVQPGPAVSLILSDESISFTGLQQTRTVSALAADTHGNQIPAAGIVWVSRNTAVAEVNGSGLVTARGAGETYVVATSGVAQDSVFVTVGL